MGYKIIIGHNYCIYYRLCVAMGALEVALAGYTGVDNFLFNTQEIWYNREVDEV